MTRVHKALAIALLFVSMLGLSACSVPDKGPDEVSEFTVTLSDGTVVPCFKINGYDGPQCNFAKAERSKAPTP